MRKGTTKTELFLLFAMLFFAVLAVGSCLKIAKRIEKGGLKVIVNELWEGKQAVDPAGKEAP